MKRKSARLTPKPSLSPPQNKGVGRNQLEQKKEQKALSRSYLLSILELSGTKKQEKAENAD